MNNTVNNPEFVNAIAVGTGYETEVTVTPQDTAASYGSGDLEVYATPAMIALMEKTAMASLKKLLPEGYTTVGTRVDIKHIKATPLHEKVHCKATITEVQYPKLTFAVEASDSKGPIGTGTHRRYIVEKTSFLANL
jgi:predicted thioesterase